MAGPIRLDDGIISFAMASADLEMRSVPKQIGYWAEIGRLVEQRVDHAAVLAILKGQAEIEVRPIASEPINVDEVFGALDSDRASGKLTKSVTQAPFAYEASEAHPGFLNRIDRNGQTVTGYFENGEFITGLTRHRPDSSAE